MSVQALQRANKNFYSSLATHDIEITEEQRAKIASAVIASQSIQDPDIQILVGIINGLLT